MIERYILQLTQNASLSGQIRRRSSNSKSPIREEGSLKNTRRNFASKSPPRKSDTQAVKNLILIAKHILKLNGKKYNYVIRETTLSRKGLQIKGRR